MHDCLLENKIYFIVHCSYIAAVLGLCTLQIFGHIVLCCLANNVRIITMSIESLLKIERMLFTILINKPNRFPVLVKLSACLSKWAAHEPLRSGSHSQQVVTGPLAFLAKTHTFKLQRVYFTQHCVCVHTNDNR